MRTALLLPALLILILFLAFLSWNFNFFTINDFILNSNGINCATTQEIKKDLNLIGKSIFSLNLKGAKANILKKYLCVKDVTFISSLPKNLQVEISPRKPLVKISLYLASLEATPSSSAALLDWSFPEASQPLFLADEDGFVFGQYDNLPLPLLFLQEPNLKVGQKLNQTIFSKANLTFNRLNQLGVWQNNSRGKLVGGSLLLDLKPKIIFNLNNNILKQLTSLQLILEKAKIDQREMESIDLRFNKPVIIYNSKWQKTE